MLSRWLHANIVYPGIVVARGEGALFSRLAELRAAERLPGQVLAQRQERRLAAMLNYAAEHSPYYHARWPAGTATSARDARRRLAELPLVTKADVQEWFDQLQARPRVGRTARKTTGGSTGQPVTVLKDRRATAYERAAMWLGYGWFGNAIGDRVARFWGVPFTFRNRLQMAAGDFAMHRVRFSAFAFREADLERYWKRCAAFRPDFLHGYVSMLEAFAQFVARRGYDGCRLGLKSIVATSEVLTPPQRERIERTFGAPVQVEYGCGEVGPIAYSCERGGLHVMTEDVVVELLTPQGGAAGPGEAGEVVVTDLNNRAMPLVRYRLGDFAVAGSALPCACGRGFPLLEKVWGRAYDFVETSGGQRYHGEFFMYLFEDLRRDGAEVQQFQVTQDGPQALDVAVVVPGRLDPALAGRIRALLAERLPEMKEVAVRQVSDIPRTDSGKMQVIRRAWSRAQPVAIGSRE